MKKKACNCDKIRRKLRIWLHLLKKFLMENFIFCAVTCPHMEPSLRSMNHTLTYGTTVHNMNHVVIWNYTAQYEPSVDTWNNSAHYKTICQHVESCSTIETTCQYNCVFETLLSIIRSYERILCNSNLYIYNTTKFATKWCNVDHILTY